MNEAGRRAETAKGGPRVLTIIPDIDIDTGIAAGIINNCPKCDLPAGVVVWNEDLVEGQRDLFVHGWYSLETDITIWWQQVNPRNACATNPWATGRKLGAGGCIAFFVDQATIDGVIVIGVCPNDDVTSIPLTCGESIFTTDNNVVGFIRVNRVDTILKMSETGDSATHMAPTPSAVCGPALPVP